MSLFRASASSRPPALVPGVAARATRPASRALRARLFSSSLSTFNVADKTPPRNPGSSQISTVFTGLLVVGVASTAFGLYEFYNSFTLWPQEIRADLRAGIKAKNQDDLILSEPYLRRAYKDALALPISAYGAEPYLKLSGIAIVLAEVLEANHKAQEAYETLLDALQRIRDATVAARKGASKPPAAQSGDGAQAAPPTPAPAPTPRERMRAVALASRLGAMAEAYQLPAAEEERLLVYAVQEMLRVMRDAHAGAGAGAGSLASFLRRPNGSEAPPAPKEAETTAISLADLQLPAWVDRAEIGAPVENLGAFYSRIGKLDYAMPLYLQAISLLIPPPPHVSQPEDRCRGAQLMSNLSELIMRASGTASSPEQATHLRQQAESWARKAQDILAHTTPGADAASLCDVALAVTLFNLGALREMADDIPAAHTLFAESLEQAKKAGVREGVLEARVALRRIDRVARMRGVAIASADDGSGGNASQEKA